MSCHAPSATMPSVMMIENHLTRSFVLSAMSANGAAQLLTVRVAHAHLAVLQVLHLLLDLLDNVLELAHLDLEHGQRLLVRERVVVIRVRANVDVQVDRARALGRLCNVSFGPSLRLYSRPVWTAFRQTPTSADWCVVIANRLSPLMSFLDRYTFLACDPSTMSMSTRMPSTGGMFALTITKVSPGAKFQMLPVSTNRNNIRR